MSQLYVGVVRWVVQDIGYLNTFWAWANHRGEAIHRMLGAAKRQKIHNPLVNRLDPFDPENLRADVLTDDYGITFYSEKAYSFVPGYSYKFPYGIVPSCIEGDNEPDDIEPGWNVSVNADGLLDLTAVVEAKELLEIYGHLISLLPSIRVFWIRIVEDWEKYGQEQIFANESLNTPQLILDFIKGHSIDILQNGHLVLTCFSDVGATNLNLSDHKYIEALSYDKDVIAKLCLHLNDCGIGKLDDLLTINDRIHHWHYRHPAGKGRTDLINMLQNEGFVERFL
ncbi:hypothetical protein Pse7367_0107 [Thalassoporum mexicanum PCC 7367]|uniref:hypothetical protein n=1 Tax=Thalassoporum mexicanum TaxID=3457544 RepID=UPI00029FC163|nr:hypothetical protein [Pseudanabaena sp. PCC 7367]AFY68425.1 hypothetical protein Pse7367_0107 [Pseudanabaena sp. PCC 7367]